MPAACSHNPLVSLFQQESKFRATIYGKPGFQVKLEEPNGGWIDSVCISIWEKQKILTKNKLNNP